MGRRARRRPAGGRRAVGATGSGGARAWLARRSWRTCATVFAVLGLMAPGGPALAQDGSEGARQVRVVNRGGTDLCSLRPVDVDFNLLDEPLPAHRARTLRSWPVELVAYGCEHPSRPLWEGRVTSDDRPLEIDYWRLSDLHPFFLSLSSRVGVGAMESSLRPSLRVPDATEASAGLVLEYAADLHLGVALDTVMVALIARLGATTWFGNTYGDWNRDGFTDTIGQSYVLQGTTRWDFTGTFALGVLGYGHGGPLTHDSGSALGIHIVDERVLATVVSTVNLFRTSDSTHFGLDFQISTDFQSTEGGLFVFDVVTAGIRGGWFL